MSIIKKQAFFNSSTGENRIRTLIWEEENAENIGIVQLAHGMAEHIDRYDDFARFLASNGYVVCGNDHLGHGLSVNSDDDYGFFAEIDGDKRIVDDMHILTRIMKKKYPELPYYLFGHSMGSLCARVYSMYFGYELDGAIFSGTLTVPKASSTLKPFLNLLVDKFGSRTNVDNVVCSLQKAQALLTRDERAAVSWLSSNKANWDTYEEDELCGFAFKLGGYRDLFNLACEACGDGWAEKIPLGLPIMVISGALDPVGFNGKGVLSVSDQLSLAGHDITVILYPGDKHEILNEENNTLVYSDILSFLTSSKKPEYSMEEM